MIVTVYGLIVFHLVVWIGVEILIKSRRSLDKEYGKGLQGFAFQAMRSRHEVHGKTLPAMQYLNEPAKLKALLPVGSEQHFKYS